MADGHVMSLLRGGLGGDESRQSVRRAGGAWIVTSSV